jgi:hypothetical protein
MKTTRFAAILAVLAVGVAGVLTVPAHAATQLELTDVYYNGVASNSATASAGIYEGNDTGYNAPGGPSVPDGSPIIDLLNGGGFAYLWTSPNTAPTGPAEFTDPIFSVIDNAKGVYGTAVDADPFTFLGKAEGTDGDGVFVENFNIDGNGTTHTLTFNETFSGSFVVAVKADGGIALYAFADAVDVTSVTLSSLNFINPNNGNPIGISHISVWIGDVTPPEAPGDMPEPASLAIWGLGLGLFGMGARRRMQKAKA